MVEFRGICGDVIRDAGLLGSRFRAVTKQIGSNMKLIGGGFRQQSMCGTTRCGRR